MKKVLLIFVVTLFVFTSCTDYNSDFDKWDSETDTETGSEEQEGGAHDEGSLSLYKVDADAITLIKDFPIGNNDVSLQADKDKHNRMWNHVIELIPGEYRDKITQFEVFQGHNELLGYVVQLDNNLTQWKFALAIDMQGSIDRIDFKNLFTIVTLHEYGHVLTLNDEQVLQSSEQACDHYFTGEGCSMADSYINELFEIGWADIIDDHNYEDPYETYARYPSRFVSEYAATNPGEDVAEVFTYFVAAAERPTGNTIADKKIKKMFDTPSLANLREKIRANSDLPTLQMISNRTLVLPKHNTRICGHRGHGKIRTQF